MSLTLDPKLTLDGVMTLVAGVIAFSAVQYQLWEERRTRRDTEKNLRQSVARAILFEINDFDRLYLQKPRILLESIGTTPLPARNLPIAKAPPYNPFPMFVSSSQIIGSFQEESIRAIIGFYSEANSFLRTVGEYSELYSKLVQNEFNHPPLESAARAYLAQMKGALPEMVKLVHVVTKEVSEREGISIKSLQRS